jgi:iron complex transport system substrate-binding protein
MIRVLGGLVGCAERADALATALERDLDRVREAAARFPRRPRVFFEEWDEPLIAGIAWVDELVEVAGGAGIYPELRNRWLAKERIVLQPGPAALTEGLQQLHALLARVVGTEAAEMSGPASGA